MTCVTLCPPNYTIRCSSCSPWAFCFASTHLCNKQIKSFWHTYGYPSFLSATACMGAFQGQKYEKGKNKKGNASHDTFSYATHVNRNNFNNWFCSYWGEGEWEGRWIGLLTFIWMIWAEGRLYEVCDRAGGLLPVSLSDSMPACFINA